MSKDEIIIFGASKLGEMAHDILKNDYKIKYFSDNDERKWGKYINDIEIISPKSLLLNNKIEIVIASMYSLQISLQLYNMGIKNIKSFKFSKYSSKGYSLNNVVDIREIFTLDMNMLGNSKVSEKNHNNIIKRNRNNSCIKKVLVIALIFPPIGGSGVQRTLKFVKNLSELGWIPIVLTVGKNFCDEKQDESLLNEIPNDVNIIRIDEEISNIENMNMIEIKEILKLYLEVADSTNVDKFIKEYCENKGGDLLIPDKHIIWVNKVIKEIDNVLKWHEIDIVFSTSAPYSDHILGYYIKKRYNIPWVADFRDEWTNNHIINYDKSKQYYKLQYLMEKSVVETADKIITVSEISEENYCNIFKLNDTKVTTITNGYDEEDFSEIYSIESLHNCKFSIVFNGTLYEEAPPYNLLIGIRNLINRNIIQAEKIQMIFIGNIRENMKKYIDNMKLSFDIIWYGYVEHKKSLKLASQGNLLFTHAGSTDKCKVSYTGKIFEYLRLCRPILVFSPKGSVLEKLLNSLNRGKSVEENDMKNIEEILAYYYDNWEKDKQDKFTRDNIMLFERKKLTEKLVQIFEELI